jgi:hypothetical protein
MGKSVCKKYVSVLIGLFKTTPGLELTIIQKDDSKKTLRSAFRECVFLDVW